MNLKVGDTVFVITSYRNQAPKEEVITRIGRKYAYVGKGHLEVGYEKDTGRCHGEFSHGYIMTKQTFHERAQAAKAQAELRAFGVDVNHCPTPKVLAIRAALDVLINSWVG